MAAVVLTALGVLLADLVHLLTVLNTWAGTPVFPGYAGVGVVIARRQPRNPVAWALIGFVLLAMISNDAGYYAVYCYRLGHHGLPLAAAAAALVPLFLPAIALFPMVILLFPGRQAGLAPVALGALGLRRAGGLGDGGHPGRHDRRRRQSPCPARQHR